MSWRNLSPFEKICFEMNKQIPAYNLVRVLRCNKLDLEAVQNSLTFVQSQHALLQSKAQNGTYILHKSPIELTPFSQNWELEMNRQANLKIQDDGPFLRATAAQAEQGTDLILSLPHGVGDGQSLNAIARQILTTTASLMRGEQPKPVGANFQPPSLAMLLKSTKMDAIRGFLEFSKEVPKFKPYQGVNFPCHDPTGLKYKDYSTAGVFRAFHGATDFKARCKEEKVSFGNAFYAISVLAARDIVQSKKFGEEEAPKRDMKCTSSITMSFRENFGVGENDIGNFSFLRPDLVDIPHDISVWELARQMAAKYKRKDQYTPNDFHKLITGTIPVLRVWLALAQHPSSYAAAPMINATNFGTFEIPDSSPVRVNEIYGLTPMAGHPPIVTSSVTTVGDTLCLAFAYSVPTQTREDVERFADRTLSLLAFSRS